MNGRNPKLGMNISPPRNIGGPSAVVNLHHDDDDHDDDDDDKSSSTNRSSSASPRSSPSSCVSSENEQAGMKYSSSPEAAHMVLAGCPYCLLYVMVSEEDPKCPKCKRLVRDYLYDKTHDNQNNKKI